MCSFVCRRLHDIIVDVISRQLVISCYTVYRRPRSSGAVPRHRHVQARLDTVQRHVQARLDTVQLLLVTRGTCRTEDRRRVEGVAWRLDCDHCRARRLMSCSASNLAVGLVLTALFACRWFSRLFSGPPLLAVERYQLLITFTAP